MNTLHEKAYAILNPDDILTLKKYKLLELQKQIQEKGGTIDNFISPYDLVAIQNENNGLVTLPKHVSEGDVLIRTSENTYAIIRDRKNIQDILKEKVVIVQHIAHLLGCTSFNGANEIVCINEISANGKFNSETDANIPIDETTKLPLHRDRSVSLNGNLSGNDRKKVEVRSKAKGVVTAEAYEEAVQYAETYHLLDDINIKTLIEERNPNKLQNITTSRHYTIELSSDIIGGVELGYQLGLGFAEIFKTKLNISAELKAEEHKKYFFEFDVEFGNINEGKETDNLHENVLPPMQSEQYNDAILKLETKCEELAQKIEEQKQLSDNTLSTSFSSKIENVQIVLDKIKEEVNSLSINSNLYDKKIQNQSTFLTEQLASITNTCQSAEQKAISLAKTIEEQKEGYEELRHTYDGKILGLSEELSRQLNSSVSELSQRLIDIEKNIKTELNESVEAIQHKYEELKQETDGKIHNLSEDFTRQLGAYREELVQCISKSEAKFKTDLSESEEKNSKQIELISNQTNQLNQKIDSEHVVLSQMVIDSEAKLKADLNEFEKDFEIKLDQINDHIDQLDQKIEKTKSDLLDTINSRIAECKQLIENMDEQFQKQAKKQKVVFYATSATIGAMSIASILLTLLLK